MATKLVQKGVGWGGEKKKKTKRRKIKSVPMDSWTTANGANLRGSEALSKANPSGQRTLLGDRGVGEVFNHTSSKRKSKNLKPLKGSSSQT